MAYALGTPGENSAAAGQASIATSAALTVALHDSIIVFAQQDTTHTTTITDALGNGAYTNLGRGTLFAITLNAYLLQDSLAGTSVITASSNGSDLSGIWAVNASGLATSGGAVGKIFLGQNGPGSGLNTVTPGPVNINKVPCLYLGFCMDNTLSNAPVAGTSPIAFTGLGSVWANKTGGVNALAEHARIVVGGNASVTFGTTAGGASHGGDLFLSCGIALAELGAVSTGGFSGLTKALTQGLTTVLTSGVDP